MRAHPSAEKRRDAYLQRTYHISLEEYNAREAAQHGLCLICLRSPHGRVKLLVVDHNHKSGKVRGLLCSECNTALGLFYDDPKTMLAAVAYLNQEGNYAELERTS
jgi:hypothetical protein